MLGEEGSASDVEADADTDCGSNRASASASKSAPRPARLLQGETGLLPPRWWRNARARRRLVPLALTPGTPFGLWCDALLDFWARQRLSSRRWRHLVIELSPSRHAGEGEVKLFYRVRNPSPLSPPSRVERDEGDDEGDNGAPSSPASSSDPDTWLVVGADTDLLLMALACGDDAGASDGAAAASVFLCGAALWEHAGRGGVAVPHLADVDPARFGAKAEAEEPSSIETRTESETARDPEPSPPPPANGPALCLSVDALRSCLADSGLWPHLHGNKSDEPPDHSGTLRLALMADATLDLALLHVLCGGNDYVGRVGSLRLERSPAPRVKGSTGSDATRRGAPGALEAYRALAERAAAASPSRTTETMARRGSLLTIRDATGAVRVDRGALLLLLREARSCPPVTAEVDTSHDIDGTSHDATDDDPAPPPVAIVSVADARLRRRAHRARPPASVPAYIQTLEWTLSLYARCEVTDVAWAYPCRAPSLAALVAGLEACAKDNIDGNEGLSSPRTPLADPLPPAAAALALLPFTAAPIAAPPLRHVMADVASGKEGSSSTARLRAALYGKADCHECGALRAGSVAASRLAAAARELRRAVGEAADYDDADDATALEQATGRSVIAAAEVVAALLPVAALLEAQPGGVVWRGWARRWRGGRGPESAKVWGSDLATAARAVAAFVNDCKGSGRASRASAARLADALEALSEGTPSEGALSAWRRLQSALGALEPPARRLSRQAEVAAAAHVAARHPWAAFPVDAVTEAAVGAAWEEGDDDVGAEYEEVARWSDKRLLSHAPSVIYWRDDASYGPRPPPPPAPGWGPLPEAARRVVTREVRGPGAFPRGEAVKVAAVRRARQGTMASLPRRAALLLLERAMTTSPRPPFHRPIAPTCLFI